ncbi:sel1 repeat family protein [Marinihelvus fidelis]|uniref:Sel1 repeat family protein n=1 Tax=Marinihelvus fidelis TaxID=2613842 RepID=A0A5N0T973_9GAMM|nr:tetratricopeptide repeat protein [Marinihelvus fidelis]KAA9130326.1 sel1 repeat family protein [Marinihelvus fidelis]
MMQIAAVVWWIISGTIAFGVVQPESFFAVIGFLILWWIIRWGGVLAGAFIVGAGVRAAEKRPRKREEEVPIEELQRQAAEEEDPMRLYELARSLDSRDSTAALATMERAAEMGLANAQYFLGVHYSIPFDDSQDYELAARWFRKAADQGFAAAQFKLGKAYYEGLGVNQSQSEALNWLRKAAELGNEYVRRKASDYISRVVKTRT